MVRTTIMLSEELKLRAQRRAGELGVSFAELLREALEERLESSTERREDDPLFADPAVYEGPVPEDSATEHDVHLYGDEA